MKKTLADSLAELERTDPAVTAAAQQLDDTVWRLTCGVPVARFPRAAITRLDGQDEDRDRV